jgi:hypothetical protein
MNIPSTVINSVSSGESDKHLLDAIRTIQASIGDGLNDDELTRLLQKKTLPIEAGFSFLSYSERFVTLSVPPQELESWYPEKGWVVAEKERIARAIAKKYELMLCEPPDAVYTLYNLQSPHHHLALINRRETVIVAHPLYLKVRLYGTTDHTSVAPAEQVPLFLGPDLLQDLSRLYQG